MGAVFSSAAGAAVNLVFFTSLPFLWWLLQHRGEREFFRWIGLYKPQLKGPWWVLALFAALYVLFYNYDFTQIVDEQTLAYLESSGALSASVYEGLGAAAVLPALIESFIANGAAEEILYRGFLCKRLGAKSGAVRGILLQAVLFGLMHNVLYLAVGLEVGLGYHALTFLFTGTGALMLGWLNEKIYNGSILPSILLHGAGNFISTMLVAFS